MEEQQAIQVINVFLRSSEIEEMKFDLFDSCDTLITNFTLSNYKRHAIHLKQHIPHFYCLLTDPSHYIEEQLEVKIPDDQANTLQIYKRFEAFAITIEVELRKPLQAKFMLQYFLQQQNELLKYANGHLRKLEESLIKRLEVEQLKKPFRERGKNGKGESIRKVKGKTNFTTLIKLPSGSQKKLQGKGYIDTLKSLGKGKHKVTDQSEPSVEEPTSNQLTTRNKKYNTVFQNNPVCHTETSSKESQKVLISAQPEPIYSQFVKALQADFTKTKQNRFKRLRQARLSHNQELLRCTLSQIQKQKKALDIIKTMSGNYSQQVSPVKLLESKVTRHKRSSPYLLLGSKTFISRKIK